MKVKFFMEKATSQLAKAGVSTSRLDCLVLVEDETGMDRARLLAYPELELSKPQLAKLNKHILRRTTHEPLAYIRGKTEFYGREFMINNHVLEPRPESETIINLLTRIVVNGGAEEHKLKTGGNGFQVVDVGTGSGCLAITANLECPELTVCGTDVSSECLRVARQNTKKHGVDIIFYRGDLLQPLPPGIYHSPTILMCNLPYVPDEYAINKAALREPKVAIFGGSDGLDLYRRLFTQINTLSSKPIYVITESLPFQHQALGNIAGGAGYVQENSEDFIQVFGRKK